MVDNNNQKLSKREKEQSQLSRTTKATKSTIGKQKRNILQEFNNSGTSLFKIPENIKINS